MGYGRLGPSEPGGGVGGSYIPEPQPPTTSNRKRKLILLSLLSVALIIASAISATLLIGLRTRASNGQAPIIHGKPTQSISKTCSKTRYPTLCVNSLLDFPGSLTASEQDLVHISFNVTLQRFGKALYQTAGMSFGKMEPLTRSAYSDCLELLDDSVDAISRALTSLAAEGNNDQIGSTNDVVTWLSAALSNQDTCTEGFADVRGEVKAQMENRLRDLAELVSNCLAIYSSVASDEFAGVPIQNRRRLMREETSTENVDAFPRWLGRKERELLSMPVSAIRADIVVSKNGTVKTIKDAIKKAPEKSNRRTIIYVMAGR